MSNLQYTQKSLETLQNAQKIAGEYGNQTLESAHILYALLLKEDELIPQLIKKRGRIL